MAAGVTGGGIASTMMPLSCYLVDADGVDRRLLADVLGRLDGATVVGESDALDSLPSALERAKADVVFLDARTCLDVLVSNLADSLGPARQFVVVSGLASDAASAFTVGAVDFLLKPYATRRVELAVARARTRAERLGWVATADVGGGDGSEQALPVSVEGAIEYVPTGAIELIAAAGYGVNIFTTDRMLTARGPLSSLLSQLADQLFVRTHRGTVVNIAKARRLEAVGAGGGLLHLGSGRSVPVAKRRMAHVRRALRARLSHRTLRQRS
jgi:two-component system LytT family response regulator